MHVPCSCWNHLCYYSRNYTTCSLQVLPEKASRIRSFFFIWHLIKKPSTQRIKPSMGLCTYLWPGQGKFWAWPCVFVFDLSAERIPGHCMDNVVNNYCNGTTLPTSSCWSSCSLSVLLRGDNQVHSKKSQNMYHIIFPFLFLSNFNL